ncbi:MAG: hypothetical protein AAGA66_00480 [Bacteroidota bacterium]
MALFCLFFLIYIGLVAILFWQLRSLLKTGLGDVSNIVSSGIILFVLILVYRFPIGMVRPEDFEDPPIFVAIREGAANCSTQILFKSNQRFEKKSMCFAVERSYGTYAIHGDSISLFFDTDTTYAKVEISETGETLKYHRMAADSLPFEMKIYRNELNH